MNSNAYTSFYLGIPDYVTIGTETETYVSDAKSAIVEFGSTKVEYIFNEEQEDVLLTSSDAVKFVKLRWEYKLPKKARYLADAWERECVIPLPSPII